MKLLASAFVFSSFCSLFTVGFYSPANAQIVQNQENASIDQKAIAPQISRNTLTPDEVSRLRSAANSSLRFERERDVYRHPVETLEFFGIKPNATVIEVWPGQGWFTTILGPYLRSGNGHLIAAHFDTTTTSSDLVKKVVDSFSDRFVAKPDVYGDVKIVPFGPRSGAMAPENSVDAVVTFRNIHNWMAQGWTEKAFKDFYTVLKPGGFLGIEEHRADDSTPQDPMAADGYVREDYIIDLAKDAGFELVEVSQINANPKDTKDHPFGVWTLPPVLRSAPMGQSANPKFDSARYKAIGESDRMTLLFRKPIKPAPTALAAKVPKPVIMTFSPPPPPPPAKKLNIKNPFAKKEEEIKTTETKPVDEVKTALSDGVNNASNVPVITAPNTAKIDEKPILLPPLPPPVIDANPSVVAPIKAEIAKTETVKKDAVKKESDLRTTKIDGPKTTKETVKAAEKPHEIEKKSVKATDKKAIATKDATEKVVTEKATTKTGTKAAAKTDAKVDSKNSSTKTATTKTTTNAKETAKANSKTDTKPETKSTNAKTKTASKTTAKSGDKVTDKTKADTKNNAKVDDNKSTKKPVKSSSKTSAKADEKSATKPATKASGKTPEKNTEKNNAKTGAKTTKKENTKNDNVPDWKTKK